MCPTYCRVDSRCSVTTFFHFIILCGLLFHPQHAVSGVGNRCLVTPCFICVRLLGITVNCYCIRTFLGGVVSGGKVEQLVQDVCCTLPTNSRKSTLYSLSNRLIMSIFNHVELVFYHPHHRYTHKNSQGR